jgi:hypothetical protein
MWNPNKVFGAHDKIIESIKKIDYAPRKIGTNSRLSRKNFQKVCRNGLMDDELKGVIWNTC